MNFETRFNHLLSLTKCNMSTRINYIYHCIREQPDLKITKSIILLNSIVSARYVKNLIKILRSNIEIFLNDENYYHHLISTSESAASPLQAFFRWSEHPTEITIPNTYTDYELITFGFLCDEEKKCYLSPKAIERMKQSLSAFSSYTSNVLSAKFGIEKWFFNRLREGTLNSTISLETLLRFANGLGVSPAYLLAKTDDPDLFIVKRKYSVNFENNTPIQLTPETKQLVSEYFGQLSIQKQTELLNKCGLPKSEKINIRNKKCSSLPLGFLHALAQETNHDTAVFLGTVPDNNLSNNLSLPQDSQILYAGVKFDKKIRRILIYIIFSKKKYHILLLCFLHYGMIYFYYLFFLTTTLL